MSWHLEQPDAGQKKHLHQQLYPGSQQEAEKLSSEADVMVVVGGKNSSNTQKLLETCRLRCKRSILVETPEDVPQNLAKADDRVALTAGASTPQWLLEQVRARIEENAK